MLNLPAKGQNMRVLLFPNIPARRVTSSPSPLIDWVNLQADKRDNMDLLQFPKGKNSSLFLNLV